MSEPREEVNSSLSGTARDVVQARDVHGGIHFHAPAADRVRPVPRQLPLAEPGFVDRCAEHEALGRLLDGDRADARVLLVTGTAGVGKTSLVLHWSHAVRDRFPDGQLYADLHGYGPQAPTAYEQVLERFLRVLGAPADAVRADGEHMAAAFRSWLALITEPIASVMRPHVRTDVMPGPSGPHNGGRARPMKKKRLITLITAGAAAATGLALTMSPAQASQAIPQCHYHAHACVAINNTTNGEVNSVRVNGQCLVFNNPGTDHYFPEVAVNYGGTPTLLTYSGRHCEGNTHNSEFVRWDQNTGSGNYRWGYVAIPTVSGHIIG